MLQNLEFYLISIPMYNLLIGIGLIFGFLFLEKEVKKYKVSFDEDYKLKLVIIATLILGFLGARFFEMFYHDMEFTFENFKNGGFTLLGGVITGFFIFLIGNLLFKLNFKKNLLLLIPPLVLVQGFGRIGCFFAGCCYGGVTDSFLGISFPEGSIPFLEHGHAKVHPTQLYEAAFDFILFFFLISKVKFEKRLPVYLFFYGLFRLSVEFVRSDARGDLGTTVLSPSQIISVLFIIITLFLIFYQRKMEKIQG
ncbi:prolipoprotein diacylglyceryl transferase [Aureivirga sp. CE67]|uniref:prolipoprotein diacylglyceryl transferase n=1 Tax=Aureivirga sp. CE67 TaxID=1788983 RepID=UPI0018CAC702|nr:prolipoprotein diacylglyceryl transferase family protein [Aureivirga sp. CE67]